VNRRQVKKSDAPFYGVEAAWRFRFAILPISFGSCPKGKSDEIDAGFPPKAKIAQTTWK
jgi:hypothetical protein